MKTTKTKEHKVKDKNFWKVPLNNVKVYNIRLDDSNKINSNLFKNYDEMELYQKWKDNNFNISFKEEKVENMSEDFRELFESNETVKDAFEKLPEHHKRQYILWVDSAMNDDVRRERIERLVKIFSQRFSTI